MYSNYDFYVNEYHGSGLHSEEEYQKFAQRSAAYIDKMTMGRIRVDSLSDHQLKRLKMCECALCESFAFSEVTRGGLISENNDGYSTSYSNTSGESTIEEASRKNIVSDYLWDTGLLYRGIG